MNTKHTQNTEPLKAKLLVEVTIENVEDKYPNYKFNYSDKKDFLMNNIVAGLEHLEDESENDIGYETIVANGMLDYIESFVSIGDKVGFINDKVELEVGKVVGVESIGSVEMVEIKPMGEEESKTIKRTSDIVINIYDLLEEQ